MRYVNVFSPFSGYSENLAKFVQRYYPDLLQNKIPVDIAFFGHVLENQWASGSINEKKS